MSEVCAHREPADNGESRKEQDDAEPETKHMVLWQYLAAHRKAAGYNQREAARRLGIKFNTLSGWETGRRAMSLGQLAHLADIYGVHPAALIFAPGDYPRFNAMRQAAEIAGRLDEATVKCWLEIGERLPAEHPLDVPKAIVDVIPRKR